MLQAQDVNTGITHTRVLKLYLPSDYGTVYIFLLRQEGRHKTLTSPFLATLSAPPPLIQHPWHYDRLK